MTIQTRDLPQPVYESIEKLVEYLSDEAEDFEEWVQENGENPLDPEGHHIYTHVKRVAAWLYLSY